MAIEVYVYYRVAPTDADALRHRVCQAQASLERQHPGLAARLLKRPPVGDADHTWMEVYAMAGPGAPPLDDAMQARIEAAMTAALGNELLRSARHVEVFEAA